MKFGIGQSVRRKEDPKFLTGRGRYVGDIEMPNMAYGYVLRSPHANAQIISIDASKAQDAPGVIAALTGEDYTAAGYGDIACHTMMPMLTGGKEGVQRPHGALVRDVVKCVGAPVAFVIAETLEQAKDAAELIEIDYEAMPAVASTAAARGDEAPLVWEGTEDNVSFTYKIGNAPGVEDALNSASHVIKATITNNRVNTNAMETRTSIGLYDQGEQKYTLYGGNQGPNRVREEIAHELLKVSEAKLQVIAPDVGGGFGMKGGAFGEDILVLWGAKATGRPVKWVGDRLESFMSDSHGRDVIADCEMAFDDDGKITGLRISADYNVGAYLSPNAGVSPMFFSILLSGVYAIPAIDVTTRCLFTNMGATAPYRGAGRPEAAYILERLLDIASRELDIDPIEIRRRNLVKADQMPYQTALMPNLDCGDFEAVMDKALEISDWQGFDARKAEASSRGKIRGRGVAVYMESAAPFNERMEIRFDPGGDVTVIAGTHSHGQGHETVYSQMVSEFLGVPFESVHLLQGDSDKVAMGRGTVGSRSMTVGGSALRNAADIIIEKGKKIAGHVLEASEGDIEFNEGEFIVAGTDKKINIIEIAKMSYTPMMWPPHLPMGLDAAGEFNPGMGNFPNGCQVAEVEVDPDTGKVELASMYIVDDVGTVINPLLLEGQIHGGVAQGVGQALFEDMVYDPESGQLLTASFQDYCMPRADDFPHFEIENMSVPTKSNPLGVKGAGETGTVGAPPAVIGAITNALGIDDIAMPATPERVWKALNESRN
ncbi:MAG: xanthine dehydrogenase family protein molybdopterin-binding subunit [Rhodospirillaceae bacterium]|jgi:aerobic carbon-monoxide dehydrogenase large subunit|nr:xanthine dehydrogenase family protein molybdopterin-binding subunit [Rhodospirillaceae bacterium]MBT4588117.1 xanthine dehydrogenase family protein molybdopterin-binding subunit [Rhodospirillaceae bacterium]MBT7268468.1 xanthine dehydrogenase family protein molybdopterin-binding subunit [Rhodospirillaceae bacterium]